MWSLWSLTRRRGQPACARPRSRGGREEGRQQRTGKEPAAGSGSSDGLGDERDEEEDRAPGSRTRARHPVRAGPFGVDDTPVSGARGAAYDDEVYLVTALVPSDTACLASSPGSARRTAVWISREVRVPFLL